MKSITYKEAEKLLEKYLDKQKEKNKDGIIKHSKAVSDFLFSICLKINKLNPNINIDCERMKIAGLLHDIGKDGIAPDILHAENGYKILIEEGFDDIAKIIRVHTIAKESCEIEGLCGYEPETIEEKLLTYSDCHIKHDKIVSFDERFDDVIERSRNNPKRYNALLNGRERVRKIIEEIDEMLREVV
jgi:putative nucleotidyltransferase with HDIG domain